MDAKHSACRYGLRGSQYNGLGQRYPSKILHGGRDYRDYISGKALRALLRHIITDLAECRAVLRWPID